MRCSSIITTDTLASRLKYWTRIESVVRSNSGGTARFEPGGHHVREQFVWFRRLGYVRIRDIVRIGALLYVLLTAVVTVLTSDLITLAFLGVLAVLALRYASIERYFYPRRRVNIYAEDELYIAEHVGTGTVRHGETSADALANLGGIAERLGDDHEPA